MTRTSLAEALEFLPQAILTSLQQENNPEGLLKDVETIVMGRDRASIADIPLVWIIEDNVEPIKHSIGANNIEFINARYEFYAINQDPDDVEESNKISRELAVRIGMTIEKQCKKQLYNNERFFDNIKFQGLYNVPNDIEGSSKTVTQSCIVYNFMIRRNRLYCGNI